MIGMSIGTLPQSRKIPRDSFALRLISLRHELDLSQEQVADLCGVKRPTWATWENGSIPRNMAEQAQKIARATGYDRDWLLYGHEDPTDPDPTKSLLPGDYGFDPRHRLKALRSLKVA